MSATRTNLTGEAARGTETRPAEATSPGEQPINSETIRLIKIFRRAGNAGSEAGLFQAELSWETLRATITRTIRIERASDQTVQCFRNEPCVN
jgi:hypothetical protein